MVAILVVLTVTILLLVDWSLQLIQARCAMKRALSGGGRNGAPLASNPFTPPQGLFFHPSHAWAQVEPTGNVKVGLDGLVGFLVGNIDRVELPSPGQAIKEGDSLARLLQGSRELRVTAPFDGEVVDINDELMPDGRFIQYEPYGAGWICEIRPKSLSRDMSKLMVGDDATAWHASEARRIIKFLSHAEGNGSNSDTLPTEGLLLRGFMEGASDEEWRRFQSEFLEAKRGENAR
jgi:glycine cleavage system H protein